MRIARWALGALLFSSMPTAAHAADVSVPQPGQSAQEQSAQQDETDEERAKRQDAGRRTPTWMQEPLYETTVEGKAVAKEDQLIGPYKQPRWTTRRRFITTRVYTQAPGVAQFEYWFDLRRPFNNDELPAAEYKPRIRTQYEFEFGLGHRLQLDLYLRTQQNLDEGDGLRGPGEVNQEKIELRWALANWGVIWGNPTLYLEYAHGDALEALEAKVLLGGDLAERAHWGLNLSIEHAFVPAEDYVNEILFTYGIAYGLVDAVFSIGAEMQLELDEGGAGERSILAYDLLVGPSIQWRPIPEFHLDLVALVGNHWKKIDDKFASAPQIHPLAVAGWEF